MNELKIEIKLPMIYHANTNKGNTFPHQVLAVGEYSGVKFYVCSINGTHPTAYIRIPNDMPLYGITYDEADALIVCPRSKSMTAAHDYAESLEEDWDDHTGATYSYREIKEEK